MKTIGFDRPLYILPFDHRGSFQFESMSSRRPVLYENEKEGAIKKAFMRPITMYKLIIA